MGNCQGKTLKLQDSLNPGVLSSHNLKLVEPQIHGYNKPWESPNLLTF
jgi:hypothetical protein